MKKGVTIILTLIIASLVISSCRLSHYSRRGYYYPNQKHYDDPQRAYRQHRSY